MYFKVTNNQNGLVCHKLNPAEVLVVVTFQIMNDLDLDKRLGLGLTILDVVE